MFNFGSGELILVCIVALIVIGPERLPMAVKTAGLWIGRFRRSFYKVKTKIERELNADEIRRQLHNESVMEDIEAAKSEVEDFAKDTEQSMNKIVNSETFDPGASKNSHQEADEEKSINEELKEVSDQVDDVAKQIYGAGKNPKLAKRDSDLESEAVSSLGSSIDNPVESEVESAVESPAKSEVASSTESPIEHSKVNPEEDKPENDVS